MSVDDYDPQGPDLQRVKSRVTPATWEKRVLAAREDEKVVRRILKRVERGATLNAAMEQELPQSRRSWALRRIPAYREEGFEVLIDERTPREPKVSVACRQVVQGARQANAQVTKEQVLEILAKQKIEPLPSESTLKREFARVDGQRRYAQKKAKAVKEVVELPLAGGELLLAAEEETGGMAVLTQTVLALADKAHQEAQGREPVADVAHRDERGHFTAS